MRRTVASLLGLLSLALLLAPSAAALPDQCGTDLPGPPSAYVGAWIPAALDDPRLPLERDPLGKFNALAGRQVSIVQRWEHWGVGGGGNIDVNWLQRVVQAGAFPMVTWDPWNPNANP